jgi:hypothetical protein
LSAPSAVHHLVQGRTSRSIVRKTLGAGLAVATQCSSLDELASTLESHYGRLVRVLMALCGMGICRLTCQATGLLGLQRGNGLSCHST